MGHPRRAARRERLGRAVQRGRRHGPLRPGRHQERRRGGDGVDPQDARGRRALPDPGGLLRAGRPAARQPARDREPHQGGRVRLARAARAPTCWRRRRRAREPASASSGTGPRGRARSSSCCRGGAGAARARAGRRSCRSGTTISASRSRRRCSASTSPAIRWRAISDVVESLGITSLRRPGRQGPRRARQRSSATWPGSRRRRRRAATAWPSSPSRTWTAPSRSRCSRSRSRRPPPACARGEPCSCAGRVDDGDKGRVVLAEDVRLLEQALAESSGRPRARTGRRAERLPHPRARRARTRASRSPRVRRLCGEHPGRGAGVPARPAATPRKWSCAPAASPSTRSRELVAEGRGGCSARARSAWTMPDALDFEQPLLEIENRIAALQAEEDSPRARDEIAKLEERLGPAAPADLRQPDAPGSAPSSRAIPSARTRATSSSCSSRTSSSCTATASSATTPRSWAASPASKGAAIVVIGHQKGRDTREKIARNFGMPHPEGYRKALRLMQLAAEVRQARRHLHRHARRLSRHRRRGARAGRGDRAQSQGDGGAARCRSSPSSPARAAAAARSRSAWATGC